MAANDLMCIMGFKNEKVVKLVNEREKVDFCLGFL